MLLCYYIARCPLCEAYCVGRTFRNLVLLRSSDKSSTMKPTYLGPFNRVAFSQWMDNAQCTIYIAKFMAFGLLSSIFILIKFFYRYTTSKYKIIFILPLYSGSRLFSFIFCNYLPIIKIFLSHISYQTHCSGEVDSDKYRRKYRLRYGVYNLWVDWRTRAAGLVSSRKRSVADAAGVRAFSR